MNKLDILQNDVMEIIKRKAQDLQFIKRRTISRPGGTAGWFWICRLDDVGR